MGRGIVSEGSQHSYRSLSSGSARVEKGWLAVDHSSDAMLLKARRKGRRLRFHPFRELRLDISDHAEGEVAQEGFALAVEQVAVVGHGIARQIAQWCPR